VGGFGPAMIYFGLIAEAERVIGREEEAFYDERSKSEWIWR
jgi:hypothetical protein